MAESARVLIVDDEPFNVDLLQQEIEDLGYETITAENGQEALDRVAEDPPDIILLDVMMPVMDGFTACKLLKDDDATRIIPIIIMTALDSTEDRVKGIEAGADDFLTKPVDDRELKARIQTALKMKRAMERRLDSLTKRGEHLEKFVPAGVRRRIDENPNAPQLEKRDQDITVLFVDICEYTRLSHEMSPGALNSLVERYFSRFLDRIHEHGGEISETSGDGMMVIFQGPDAEAMALAAVRATVAIFHETRALNRDRDAEPIRLHAGINSGLAAVGSTRYEGSRGSRWVFTADGLVINVAARLASGAPKNAIWIGPLTAERIRNQVSLEGLGPHRFKNVADPVEVHRLVFEPEATEAQAAAEA